jgi:hypothetical protein
MKRQINAGINTFQKNPLSFFFPLYFVEFFSGAFGLQITVSELFLCSLER